jgi:hypothetical protein
MASGFRPTPETASVAHGRHEATADSTRIKDAAPLRGSAPHADGFAVP